MTDYQAVFDAVSHHAQMAGQAWQLAAYSHETPSAVYRPALSIDGNKWCALYGEDLMNGVAGFGDSPAEAMADFDHNWSKKLEGGSNDR